MGGFVRVYGGNGHLPVDVPIQGGDGALAELVLPDGRTLVVALRDNGNIMVRAFGTDPLVTGHAAALELHGHVPLIQDLIVGDAVATVRQFAAKKVLPRHLVDENDPARPLTEKACDTLIALRTMLALRNPS